VLEELVTIEEVNLLDGGLRELVEDVPPEPPSPTMATLLFASRADTASVSDCADAVSAYRKTDCSFVELTARRVCAVASGSSTRAWS
jgi:hypothetical protein